MAGSVSSLVKSLDDFDLPCNTSRMKMKTISVSEAASIIGCTKANVYAIAKAGTIRSEHLGINGWFLRVSQVDVVSYAKTPCRTGRSRKSRNAAKRPTLKTKKGR